MNEQDDLIGDLITEVARYHGVAISRDEPIVAVVLLNQIVLRRYLEETVAPASDAIRDATTEAVRQIEGRWGRVLPFAPGELSFGHDSPPQTRVPRRSVPNHLGR